MHEIIEMTALPQFLKSTSIHKFAYLIGKAQRTTKIVLGIEANSWLGKTNEMNFWVS